MKIFKLLCLTLLFSCAKLSYVAKQSYGQLALELKGVDNGDVLKDKNIPKEQKEKIKSIVEYKNYFYKYFDKEPTAIYSETSFLKGKAVSYLVIASKFYEIKPLKHSFPFAGEFPYLGFYSLEDAKDFQSDLDPKLYYTYIRPVFAYSTLNRLFFKDNILSSFFVYDRIELAELIFHELTHTIFFIDNNVSFNESLANYIGEEMTIEYLKISKEENSKRIQEKEVGRKLYRFITQEVKKYKKLLKDKTPKSKKQADQMLATFLKDSFLPAATIQCEKLKVDKCWPLKRKWNNASFTAFLTYNKRKNFIAELRGKRSLKEFMDFLNLKKEEFEQSKFKDFTKFLKAK